MAIYQVVTGSVHCDICGKFIAELSFDRNDTNFLERAKVRCVKCGAKEVKTKNDTTA